MQVLDDLRGPGDVARAPEASVNAEQRREAARRRKAEEPKCPECGGALSYQGFTTVTCVGKDGCSNLDPVVKAVRASLAEHPFGWSF